MKNIKMISSKQINTIIAMCLSLFLIVSCDETEDSSVIPSSSNNNDVTLSASEISEIGIASSAASDDVMEDIDDIAEDAISGLDAISNARKGPGFGDRDCVTREVSKDTLDDAVTTTITLEFDGSCVSARGKRVRNGKIIIVKTGKKNESGATHTMTFEDFSVDSIKIEGTRKYENLTPADEEGTSTVSMTLTGGKLTFPDETFATREGTTTKVRNRTAGTVTLTGSTSGVSREGADYSFEITEALVFDKSCEDTFIPVKGIKKITKDGAEIIKNYGDGTCDNKVEVTRDGETEEIEVKSRKRFPKAKAAFVKRRGNRK